MSNHRVFRGSKLRNAALFAGLFVVRLGPAETNSDHAGPNTTGGTSTTEAGPRVAPGVFELDAFAGTLLRGWEPQQYPTVRVETSLQATWHADVRARIGDIIRIHRAYYESSGIIAPRGQLSGQVEAIQHEVDGMAWLIGMLGVPALRMGGMYEPFLRYEALAFVSTAYPTEPLRFVPRDTPAEGINGLPLTTSSIQMATTFETVIAGVSTPLKTFQRPGLGSGANGLSEPRYFAGLGVTQYSKPYMARVGDNYVQGFLFDARFDGIGIGFGLTIPPRQNRPYFDLTAQIGAGSVQLLDEFEISEESLPEHLGVGYLQGNLSGGYPLTLMNDPIFLSFTPAGSIGGMYFYVYEKSNSDSSESEVLNWDVLWSVGAQMVAAL